MTGPRVGNPTCQDVKAAVGRVFEPAVEGMAGCAEEGGRWTDGRSAVGPGRAYL
jgi:hypothetical protein